MEENVINSRFPAHLRYVVQRGNPAFIAALPVILVTVRLRDIDEPVELESYLVKLVIRERLEIFRGVSHFIPLLLYALVLSVL
jgi:hypothetical protein